MYGHREKHKTYQSIKLFQEAREEREEETGRPALRSRSAREKLLAAAKVERAYCLIMENEWRSRHCTLSENLSNDSSVFSCTATVTRCLTATGLCVCVRACVLERENLSSHVRLMCSVIRHHCLCVCMFCVTPNSC